MPIASVHIRDSGPSVPKEISSPKEASARGWWNEARKTFPRFNFKAWALMPEPRRFDVSSEVIIFEAGTDVRVIIARKRRYR